MTDEKEITGWVAWHPRHGVDTTSFAAYKSLVVMNMEKRYQKAKTHPLDDGWVIRPVKLVFTDTEK